MNGGKRPGAGRPKGSTSKPQFRDYFTEQERIDMVEMVKTHMVDDLKLLQFAVEQNFGKAPQSIDHTTLGKELPTPILNALPSDDSAEENTAA